MPSRVLFYDILHVIRLEGFFKLSPRHKELDLLRMTSQETINDSRPVFAFSDRKCIDTHTYLTYCSNGILVLLR